MTKFHPDPRGFAAMLRDVAARLESGEWVLSKSSSTKSLDPGAPESASFTIRPRIESDPPERLLVDQSGSGNDMHAPPGHGPTLTPHADHLQAAAELSDRPWSARPEASTARMPDEGCMCSRFLAPHYACPVHGNPCRSCKGHGRTLDGTGMCTRTVCSDCGGSGETVECFVLGCPCPRRHRKAPGEPAGLRAALNQAARPEASTFQCPGCRTQTATLAVTNNGMRCPHCQLRFWVKSEPTGLAAQTEAELRKALDRVSGDLRDDPRAAELSKPPGNTGPDEPANRVIPGQYKPRGIW